MDQFFDKGRKVFVNPQYVPCRGFNDVTNTTFETVWPNGMGTTLAVRAPEDVEFRVYSASAADAAAGTGARTVQVDGVDKAFNPVSYTYSLSGTTATPSSGTKLYMINGIRVLTVGSGGENAGLLRGFNEAGTYAQHAVLATWNQMPNIVYTIPRGKVGYVTSIMGNVLANSAQYAEFAFRYYAEGSLDVPITFDQLIVHGTSSTAASKSTLHRIPSKSIVYADVRMQTSAQPVSAGYDLFLVDE